MLINRVVIMIVKKTKRVDEVADDSVEVLRMSDDIDLIKQFHFDGTYFTPTKVVT
jgi:hypothetical protein